MYLAENNEKDLLYGILPKESFEAQVEVADENIRQLYEIIKDKLTSPAKAKLAYYFIPTESDAAPMVSRLENRSR